MPRNVTVLAYGDEHVHLIAIEEANRLIYVAAPDSLERIANGLTEPVGVPREDVTEGWGEPAGKKKEAAN